MGKERERGSERRQTPVWIVPTVTESGRRGVTGFFDERLRGFVCERAAVQSAEFVLIQHMVKNSRGGGGRCVFTAGRFQRMLGLLWLFVVDVDTMQMMGIKVYSWCL